MCVILIFKHFNPSVANKSCLLVPFFALKETHRFNVLQQWRKICKLQQYPRNRGGGILMADHQSKLKYIQNILPPLRKTTCHQLFVNKLNNSIWNHNLQLKKDQNKSLHGKIFHMTKSIVFKAV